MNNTLEKILKEFDEGVEGLDETWFDDPERLIKEFTKDFLIKACKEYAKSVVPEEKLFPERVDCACEGLCEHALEYGRNFLHYQTQHNPLGHNQCRQEILDNINQ